MDKFLIVEGTTDTSNGDLRGAIARLLQQKLDKNMPRIIMGNGKGQSIDKFLNQPREGQISLLVDMDTDEPNREDVLTRHKVAHYADAVFFMVQEMEAWFLSQPQILDNYYGIDISSKIKRPAHAIADPCGELQRFTKDTKKKSYHKVRHAVDLLPKLDLTALCISFTDVQKLVDRLSI